MGIHIGEQLGHWSWSMTDKQAARLAHLHDAYDTGERKIYVPAKAVAKEVRRLLKETWPGVKFSVRVKRITYSDGIDIRWADGPTERQVDSVVGHFEGSSFDPTVDLSESVTVDLPDGRRVHYSVHSVSLYREHSPAALAKVAAETAKREGIDPATFEVRTSEYDGYGWIATEDWQVQHAILKAMQGTDLS